MELSQQRSGQPYGLLYPMMLIAAIAVIVFSILGIVSIAGWMPSALSAASVTELRISRDAEGSAAAAFECAECGMIESIREMERSGANTNLRVETASTSRL
jgi:hypothetical protein